MPAASPADIRTAVARRAPAPVYLLLGDDDAELSRLAGEFTALVEDELRAFNGDRRDGSDKSTTAASIAESARLLPMMSDRRIVVVLRAEKLLKPKRRGKLAETDGEEDDGGAEPPSDLDALTDYVQNPSPSTTLLLVASDIDRTRRAGKAILKHATV